MSMSYEHWRKVVLCQWELVGFTPGEELQKFRWPQNEGTG